VTDFVGLAFFVATFVPQDRPNDLKRILGLNKAPMLLVRPEKRLKLLAKIPPSERAINPDLALKSLKDRLADELSGSEVGAVSLALTDQKFALAWPGASTSLLLGKGRRRRWTRSRFRCRRHCGGGIEACESHHGRASCAR
jgi:hypothetical protein